MNIQLQERGPIVRLYRWSRVVWHSFGGAPDYGESRTDFCTISRAILIQMPLALAINAVAIGFAGYVAFNFLSLMWLNLGPVGIFVLIVAGIAAFVATIVGLSVLGGWAAEKIATSETASAIATAYRAKKANICPVVEIAP